MKLEIDHVSLPRDGELENGDSVVTRIEGDHAMIAVVDALGHGPPAASVAALAVARLAEIPLDTPVAKAMEDLDVRLRGTRGAAIMLCLFKVTMMEACSVGNVEVRCVGVSLPMVSTPGIVGNTYRKLKVYEGPIPSRERLIVHTDGISARFDPAEFGLLERSRADVCSSLMDRLRRGHDDATVLVADLENGP